MVTLLLEDTVLSQCIVQAERKIISVGEASRHFLALLSCIPYVGKHLNELAMSSTMQKGWNRYGVMILNLKLYM